MKVTSTLSLKQKITSQSNSLQPSLRFKLTGLGSTYFVDRMTCEYSLHTGIILNHYLMPRNDEET